jgi:hypothetical protein
MRFPPVARRIILAPVLALALAASIAACSSGSSPSSSAASAPAASSPAASSPTASSPAVASASATDNAAAAAEITANWEKFFSASTPTSERAALLQNGGAFTAAISALAKLPLASGLGSKVTAVTLTSATTAAVTYNIVSGSTSLLSGQKGTSVYQDGTWKVGDPSLCGLIRLTGSVPAACNSAG